MYKSTAQKYSYPSVVSTFRFHLAASLNIIFFQIINKLIGNVRNNDYLHKCLTVYIWYKMELCSDLNAQGDKLVSREVSKKEHQNKLV